MRTYWYNRVPNFGDAMAPLLLERLGIAAEWAPPDRAEIVTVGSILSQLPHHYRGIVLGSGLIAADRHVNLRRARVLAVRGALTRDRMGLPRGTLLADPGILAPFLMPVGAPERAGVVVAPHYVDQELRSRYPDGWLLDVTVHPADILAELNGADLVITSSLHVAIAADALGILHVVEPHPKVVGGLFKFEDYASAFGMGLEPGVPRLTPRGMMEARQEELRDYYLSLVPTNRRAIA